MGKRKKTNEKDTQLFIKLIHKELEKLKFKELKNIYEEGEPENDVEKYIQSAALREMQRRNPNWSGQ